jgi:hypothetical protein
MVMKSSLQELTVGSNLGADEHETVLAKRQRIWPLGRLQRRWILGK